MVKNDEEKSLHGLLPVLRLKLLDVNCFYKNKTIYREFQDIPVKERLLTRG